MTLRVDLSNLKGKSILVTGGGSGLGLATVRSFAAAGAYVTIADIQSAKDHGDKLVQELSGQNNNVTYAQCDVTSWESQIQAFKVAVKFSPNNTLDVVAMFAGTGGQAGNLVSHVMKNNASLDEDPPKPGTACIEINMTGEYYSSFLALHYFRLKPSNQSQGTHTGSEAEALPSKALIFVSSMAGYIDYPSHTVYNAGKFGVRAMFRSVRGSAAKEMNVRCNLIAPWYIDTPMTAEIKQYMKMNNVKDGQGISFAKIEDVVDATAICAADESVEGMFCQSILPGMLVRTADSISRQDGHSQSCLRAS